MNIRTIDKYMTAYIHIVYYNKTNNAFLGRFNQQEMNYPKE